MVLIFLFVYVKIDFFKTTYTESHAVSGGKEYTDSMELPFPRWNETN